MTNNLCSANIIGSVLHTKVQTKQYYDYKLKLLDTAQVNHKMIIRDIWWLISRPLPPQRKWSVTLWMYKYKHENRARIRGPHATSRDRHTHGYILWLRPSWPTLCTPYLLCIKPGAKLASKEVLLTILKTENTRTYQTWGEQVLWILISCDYRVSCGHS